MNINDFKNLYRRTVTGAGSSSGIVYLELDRVKPGALRVLTHVAVENKTSASTKFRLAIKHLSRTHYVDELITVAAGELVVSRSDIILGEQDVLCSELTGTTNGDDLVMSAIGWEATLK